MSLRRLASVAPDSFDVLSVDLFDTLLLRDYSLQRVRFAEISVLIAAKLRALGHDIPASALLAGRQEVHKRSYAAVALECPGGDATLEQMLRIQLALFRLPVAYLPMLIASELEVEARHLSPSRGLLKLVARLKSLGKRVVATSDMYLSGASTAALIESVIGSNPLDQIYMSSDLGTTKHAGTLFARVAALEGVQPARILHCGDHPEADVIMSRAAGCQAVLLRRPTPVAAMRFLSAARLATGLGGMGA